MGENTDVYDEVEKLEQQIEHVVEMLNEIGVESGTTTQELQEKGLSYREIQAARRFAQLMNHIHDMVDSSEHSGGSDDSDDDDGSGDFRVDGTLR